MMGSLLLLDRHDVLETIRKSNSLREAFLNVAKLQADEKHYQQIEDLKRQLENANRMLSFLIGHDNPD